MFNFRNKSKDKAANSNTSTKDAAHTAAPSAVAAEETEDATGPQPKAEPAPSEDVKQ